MKKTSLILSLLLLLFAGGVWGEDENIIKDLNLEGRWIAAYLPISYEEIIDVSKQGNEYIVTKVRGDQYVPSGEVSMKADLNFQNCKAQGASKGFKNPYGVVNGSDNAVHNGSNTSVSNNQGITFFYIGILGSDCTVRAQSYWLKDGRNELNNQCIPF